MDLVILNKFSAFFYIMLFLIDQFTGSKYRFNINSNFATLMMPQPYIYNFGSRFYFFFPPECYRIKNWYTLFEIEHIFFYINIFLKIRATSQKRIFFGTYFKKSAFLCIQHELDFSFAGTEAYLGLCQTSVKDHTYFSMKKSIILFDRGFFTSF